MKIRTMSIVTLLVISYPAMSFAAPGVSEKLGPYIDCINGLSERAFQSQERYVGWAGDKAKLNTKALNISGLYEIYDPSDCAKGVEEANAAEPHDTELEGAATAYVKAAQALEAILKPANDYYDQGNYKDDKMAKGKELHPQLLAAYHGFAKADGELRAIVQRINDEKQITGLSSIEKAEGRNGHYLIEALMIKAKAVVRVEGDVEEKKMDLAKVNESLSGFEAAVNELDDYKAKHKDEKIGSMFLDDSKSFLTSAKELMRRVRDKVPFDEGQKMILSQPNAGWMVEGSQPKLTHDYNSLVDTYNQHLGL